MGVDINTAFGKKGGNQITFLISLLIVVAIVVVAVKIYKGVKTGSKLVGDQLGDQLTSQQTGVSVARINYIRSTAADLWTNSTKNLWLYPGFDYVEEDFISAINSMFNLMELKMLGEFYKGLHEYGTDIKGVVRVSFDNDDKNRIKTEFKAVLV